MAIMVMDILGYILESCCETATVSLPYMSPITRGFSPFACTGCVYIFLHGYVCDLRRP